MLLADGWVVKIADFGLTRVLDFYKQRNDVRRSRLYCLIHDCVCVCVCV